ncbi:hypothetical protein AGLY_014861 [Aphis glycines]|uniref:Uncharacterized protein n=1 Tax=Aphis glycines TaxID=307491 RepID=A0A6G0T4H5_APHGL|nr:hypothetical protein AGLY_014861 [Aphis glycines]
MGTAAIYIVVPGLFLKFIHHPYLSCNPNVENHCLIIHTNLETEFVAFQFGRYSLSTYATIIWHNLNSGVTSDSERIYECIDYTMKRLVSDGKNLRIKVYLEFSNSFYHMNIIRIGKKSARKILQIEMKVIYIRTYIPKLMSVITKKILPFLLTDNGSPSLSTTTREHVASNPIPSIASDDTPSISNFGRIVYELNEKVMPSDEVSKLKHVIKIWGSRSAHQHGLWYVELIFHESISTYLRTYT